MLKDKLVLGLDDVLLLLTHLWAKDAYIFLIEDQRHVLTTILPLLIFIGARPVELIDIIKYNAPYKYLQEYPETPNLDEEELIIDLNNLDNKQLDLLDYLEDPNYDQA